MLESMHVRNFAIIDEVSVEFGAGMNVLTGETGAGKSILVDALALVLGARGSADSIRAGAKRAEITARFAIDPMGPAAEWLREQALDDEDECVLRRVVNADGRSRAFINGNPAPLQSLRALGRRMVNIHGQHEHQSLQRSDHQRELLDARGGLAASVSAVSAAHGRWETLDRELSELREARAQRAERRELLDFQLRELEQLALSEGEVDALHPEHRRLANAGRLSAAADAAIDTLYEREPANVQALLAEASRTLAAVAEHDDALPPVLALLAEAEVSVSEATETLRRYAADIESDPARLTEVETRMADIDSLARKHRIDASELAAHTERLRAERDELAGSDQRIEQLTEDVAQALADLRAAASTLTGKRKRAARAFGKQISQAMSGLGMPGGQFEVRVEDAERAVPARHGADRIEFFVSANPGQPARPIGKVASGGELSRISLAIQAAAGRVDRLPCMIFDEVDTGVGGGVAEIVGREMHALARECQVLAVTHLPQVAGQADHHLRVNKMSDGASTRTTITVLGGESRVEEIARMLGGVSITDTTRDHAREMLQKARSA